jgi:hypothetical protein
LAAICQRWSPVTGSVRSGGKGKLAHQWKTITSRRSVCCSYCWIGAALPWRDVYWPAGGIIMVADIIAPDRQRSLGRIWRETIYLVTAAVASHRTDCCCGPGARAVRKAVPCPSLAEHPFHVERNNAKFSTTRKAGILEFDEKCRRRLIASKI